jgi:hypothetical protein
MRLNFMAKALTLRRANSGGARGAGKAAAQGFRSLHKL